MAKFWATFRLAKDLTDDSRRSALIAAFQSIGKDIWAEPTSFLAFDADYRIDQIAAHLKKAIDPEIDIVLIREIGHTTTHYIGTPDNPGTFAAHFPGAKRTG